ncbi:MAG TPA: hypothetical protein VGL74_06555 [Terriglobales bacterium]
MTSYSNGRYSQGAMNGLNPGNAFIIQFRTESNSGAVKLAGRIEHVLSGKTSTFDSLNDLPRLLLEMLQDCQPADPGEV